MTWRQQPAIWQVSDLPPTAKLVLLALAFFSNSRGGGAYPSQATLARMCGVAVPTIKRALRTLLDRHLIETEGKGVKGTIRYRIALPMSGGGRSPASYNPVNRYPVNKKGGLIIDRFSDLAAKEPPHWRDPDSPPEPSWIASLRAQRSGRR